MTSIDAPWLIDHCAPKSIVKFFETKGIKAASAFDKGWSKLSNGNLVEAAALSGMNVIVTLDRLFEESAHKSLKKHPHFCIVLISIPQRLKRADLLQHLESLWTKAAIVPVSGKLIKWP